MDGLQRIDIALIGAVESNGRFRRHELRPDIAAQVPETWTKAHARLYDYYRSTTEDRPATVAGISRLYSAVAHGCEAALFESAFQDVYWSRIQQGAKFVSSRILGALGADLEAIAHFFVSRWTTPVPDLTPPTRARIMAQAGFDLRGVGQLRDADQVLRHALGAYEELHDWDGAASVASNLSVLYVTLGKLRDAVKMAEIGVTLADRGNDPFRRRWERTTLASALHQLGNLSEAIALFDQAETIGENTELATLLITLHHGFRQNDILLSLGRLEEVIERGGAQIEGGTLTGNLLLRGFGHLSVGRARLLQGSCGSETTTHLNEAVSIIRRAGQQIHVPLPLLARGELFRMQTNFRRAKDDLDEATFLSKRAGMLLHECDCHLGYARLFCDTNDGGLAKEHYHLAREMKEGMGYRRRDREIATLERQLYPRQS